MSQFRWLSCGIISYFLMLRQFREGAQSSPMLEGKLGLEDRQVIEMGRRGVDIFQILEIEI